MGDWNKELLIHSCRCCSVMISDYSTGIKAKFTDRTVFEAVEDRDGMAKFGMEEGAAETTDRLVELLKELQKG